MTRLIFDIETVGVEFESLDKESKEFLLYNAQSPDEEKLIKEGLGFSPLTGHIVAIGFLNPDTNKGAVYFDVQNSKIDKSQDSVAQYIPFSSEKELLKSFWEVSEHYDQFITFNGHSFDCPFLMIRSAVNKIKPPVNLMDYRFRDIPHLDLYDKLTNYGAVRWKRTLHLWCQAFNIESSKSKGVTGDDVARLYKDKKYLDIARYCYDDVRATGELFDYWEKYFK